MTKALAGSPIDERVFEAAAKLFREKGFAATTVREIAREAGMLPGSLHYRFASKDELLIALMEHGVSVAMAAVRQAVADEADPVQRIRVGICAHLELLLSGNDAVFVLLYDWRSLKGAARERVALLRERYEAFWDGMLYEAVGTGRGRQSLDVPLLRQFGFGAINWAATWYQPQDGRTPAQIADAFWTVMAFGLLSEAARPPDVEALFKAVFSKPSKPKKGGPRGRIAPPRA